MAVSCSILAGIFCLYVSYPAQPRIVASVDTNGLAGSIQLQGTGWHVDLFSSDALVLFDPKGAKKICVQNSCLNFRRNCSDSDGHVHCAYDLNMGGPYLTRFTLDADSRDVRDHAVQSIGLYGGDGRQTLFPLALLDQAGDAPK